MARYEWPPDEVLAAAVEKESPGWLAAELGVPETTLRSHLKRRGLPTTAPSVDLPMSDALKAVAKLASP